MIEVSIQLTARTTDAGPGCLFLEGVWLGTSRTRKRDQQRRHDRDHLAQGGAPSSFTSPTPPSRC